MRIGSTIHLFKGYCYNSYKWNYLRPFGNFKNILKSLDELKIDEILVLRPIKGFDSNQDWDIDIEEIKNSYTSTPLIFGGGVRTISRLKQLKYLPIERLAFSSNFISKNYKNLKIVEKAIIEFGKQAIISVIPYTCEGDNIFFYNSEEKCFIQLCDSLINIINEYSNEILLYNIKSDGMYEINNIEILKKDYFDPKRIIYTGGVNKFSLKYLYNNHQDLAAIYIDNKILFEEQHVYKLKKFIY